MKLKHVFQPFTLLLALAGLTLSAGAQVEGPPSFVDYQGTIYDSTGRPYGSEGPVDALTAAPENKTMEFRIYDKASGGDDSNIIWAETQTVTVSLGQFSVRLGSGAQITAPSPLPHEALSEAFDGKERYLELTVINPGQTPSPILPRLAFQSSPFSFVAARARVADSVSSVGGSSLTGTELLPLTIAGKVTATGSSFTGGSFGDATLTDGTFSGGNFADGTFTGGTFAGNGAGLNNLDASKITTGTLAAGLFPNPFPLTGLNVSGGASISQLTVSNRILLNSLEFWDSQLRGGLFVKGATGSWLGSSSAAVGDLVLSGANGKLHLQTKTGAAAMTINQSNFVGIGTSNPTKAKLQVVGGPTRGVNGTIQYLDHVYQYSGFPDYAAFRNGIFNGAYPNNSLSIHADQGIQSKFYIAVSDERIKEIIGRSESERDLGTLQAIEITDYRYKDVIADGNASHKKVIAQQVEKVFPQAVSKSTDVVPDIYERAPTSGGWVMLATDLKKGERVRLIGETEQGIHEVLEVADGKFRTDFEPAGDKVFVFGREVDDFCSVDYEAIAMLNVSATQQIKKELDVVKAENESLKTLIKQLAEKDQAREARMIAIEKRIGSGGESDLKTVSVRKGEQ